jgi:hypothetical protein
MKRDAPSPSVLPSALQEGSDPVEDEVETPGSKVASD